MRVLTTNQAAELLRRVEALTKDQLLTWQAINPYKFRVIVGDTSLVISSDDQDDLHPYTLQIHYQGSHVQDVNSEVWEGRVEGTGLNIALSETYAAAKRQALKLDVVVQGVFSDLGVDVPPEDDDVPF
jgi:hypothetical protein